jgi:hypothetical protein
MRMKLLTYSSFASPGIQPAEIEQILTVSRANNARDAVTGLLMFNGAAFVQAIEGPVAAVDRLYVRLLDDRRHCEISLHDDLPLSRRAFGEWTMGYVQINGGWLEGQYDVADALARDMPASVRELLMSMANTLPFE